MVDDDPDIRLMAEVALRRAGHEVVTTSDGAGARALVEGECPDVVLLDVQLGQEDGRAVLRSLRAASDPPPSVAYFTGTARSPGEGGLEDDPGVVGVIQKPFDPEALAGKVSALLERGGAGDG